MPAYATNVKAYRLRKDEVEGHLLSFPDLELLSVSKDARGQYIIKTTTPMTPEHVAGLLKLHESKKTVEDED
ncbi:hypothetical protein MKZ38_000716 [Zalerion maritima]|uniref:Uncharacterized protein n=1 Tax=Zalerion maritima TaxID=339359 RepID=A0AAD5RRX1_9PEZI|nr:hypothetical protein MKZ38_000716 [Zalerion maritima]